jgi:hypothetical protein
MRLGTDLAKCARHGAPLDFATDGFGRLRPLCVKCDRYAAGRCIDCAVPVAVRRKDRPHVWRCEACRVKAQDRHQRKYRRANCDKLAASALDYLNALSPEERQARNDYKRQWRKANPDRVKAHKAVNNGYRSREKYLAYLRKWRARQKAKAA